MVVTMAAPTLRTDAVCCCPGCGYDLPPIGQTQAELLDARSLIASLEAQVRVLSQKATTAVDRLADYEDEVTKLRSENPDDSPRRSSEAPQSLLQASTNRISQLLSRKSTPNLRSTTSPSPSPSADPSPISEPAQLPPPLPPKDTSRAEDLQRALTREKSLRKEAEGRLTDTSREIEDLSVSLFEQANEMVAEERRARAKLEERVGELEKRDMEKRGRLERLEGAMGTIQRVRELLNE